MPRRPKDEELCAEFARQLGQAIGGKVRKKTAAAILGVSRQMLHLYLNEKATPGPDVVVRAMKAWNFKIKYRGRELTAAQLIRSEDKKIEQASEQLPLPLLDAIHSLSEEDIAITLTKKEADSIDLRVSIRFAG